LQSLALAAGEDDHQDSRFGHAPKLVRAELLSVGAS
jgi:hypothetical protein